MTIAIICIIIAAIANSEMDSIQYNSEKCFFNTTWWCQKSVTVKSWWLKNVFSFLINGWHLCKSIMIVSICFGLAYLAGDSLTAIMIHTVVLYVIFGLTFNLFYYK